MRLTLRAIVTGVGLALMAASSGGASAQSYPTRPITIVVPYPAGGPTDTLARVMSDRLKAALGQTIVIENITGAGGSIGVGHVAHAAPDGYTLALGHNQTHVINAVTLKLNYDVVKDFEPVTLIADTPIWIVARKSLPADDMNGFVAWLKENGDKANAGTVGVGGPNDLAALDFQKKTDTHFQLTPYRGGAPLLQDLLAGHIDFTFGQASTYLPYVRNGQIKAYGVLMPKRWWAAPEVPTLDELGIKGTYATFWHGIWAPKDTPKPIIAKLDSAFMETLADPAVKQRFKDVGQEMWPIAQQNPAGLAAQQKAEIERWWPIVKDAGIKPQ